MAIFTESATQPTMAGTSGNGTRRSFLQKLGFWSLLTGLAGLGYQTFRSLIPNVLYEPPKKFKIGNPDNLPEGITFLEHRRLYLFREGKSFHALSAACTHLGCTVKHAKLQQPKQVEIGGEKKEVTSEFHCPCHGSKFYADGTNYAGPAPTPLQCYMLEVAPDDGQIIVNLGEEVEQNFRLTV
jgi:menaquinol-cytochrome c reductase iron-sulfur subunit